MLDRFVIVRTREQGVVCGTLKTLTPQPGGLACAELTDARQIHYWSDGANTLFEMCVRGCGTARISEPVPEVMVFGVCGVLPCSTEAEVNLSQSRWNAAYDPSRSPRRATKPRG